MALRVCILAQATPFTWVDPWVRAFRACCDVVTVGPTLDVDTLRESGRSHLIPLAHPHDVEADLGAIADLYDVLPAGWEPQLVVAISGGGVPMFTKTASLGCPSVFLSIDTWQCLMDHIEALHYDVVFAAQREYVQHLRDTGSRHVFWLPLGCCPDMHHPVEAAEDHDVVFVGGTSAPVHTERARLIEVLNQHFSVLSLEHVHGEDMCRAFCRGRLAFNHSAVEDLNMRVFEAMAMGRPLLTNRDSVPNGLLDLFEDGKHLIVYDSDEDLVQKVYRFLEDEAPRTAVARAGREEVLAKHTYRHRVDALFEKVRELVPGFDESARGSVSRGDKLKEHLPRMPGVVVDLGMGLEESKHAAHRHGVTRLIGVGRDAEHVARRSRSYDEALVWPSDAMPGNVDTVVAAGPDCLGGALADMLGQAYQTLCPGGTLVLRLSDVDLAGEGLALDTDPFYDWFREHDFHVTHTHRLERGGCILSARKRTRRLRDIVTETFTRLHVPGLPPETVAAMVPPGI